MTSDDLSLIATSLSLPSDEETLLQKANKILANLDFQISTARSPVNGCKVYAIKNTANDLVSHAATTYSPNELVFFSKLLNEVACADNFKVSSKIAMGFSKGVGMTKKQAEGLFERFVGDHWFDDINGKLTFGIRSLIELPKYVRDQFNVILPTCTVCHDVATVHSEHCQESNCRGVLHVYCREMLFRNLKDDALGKCPTCQAVWVEGKENRKKRAQRVSNDDDDEEEENEIVQETQEEMDEDINEEEEDDDQTQLKRPTTEDDEEEEEEEEEEPIKPIKSKKRKL